MKASPDAGACVCVCVWRYRLRATRRTRAKPKASPSSAAARVKSFSPVRPLSPRAPNRPRRVSAHLGHTADLVLPKFLSSHATRCRRRRACLGLDVVLTHQRAQGSEEGTSHRSISQPDPVGRGVVLLSSGHSDTVAQPRAGHRKLGRQSCQHMPAKPTIAHAIRVSTDPESSGNHGTRETSWPSPSQTCSRLAGGHAKGPPGLHGGLDSLGLRGLPLPGRGRLRRSTSSCGPPEAGRLLPIRIGEGRRLLITAGSTPPEAAAGRSPASSLGRKAAKVGLSHTRAPEAIPSATCRRGLLLEVTQGPAVRICSVCPYGEHPQPLRMLSSGRNSVVPRRSEPTRQLLNFTLCVAAGTISLVLPELQRAQRWLQARRRAAAAQHRHRVPVPPVHAPIRRRSPLLRRVDQGSWRAAILEGPASRGAAVPLRGV